MDDQKLILHNLFVSILVLFCVILPTHASEDLFQRPQCQTKQLVFGICVHSNISQAVALSKSEPFKASFQSIIEQAEAYLNTISPAPNKLILVDLDETLVNNVGYYEQYRVFHPQLWEKWVTQNDTGPYWPSVLSFVQNAQKAGFRVMFITGRPSHLEKETLEQVSAISWDGGYFRPEDFEGPSSLYKIQTRQMLKNKGYQIVLNLGDQLSDFDLPVSSEDGEFLLPNIMYAIP